MANLPQGLVGPRFKNGGYYTGGVKGKEARYRAKNPEKRALACKQWGATHLEQVRALRRKWYAAHRDRHAASVRKRKLRVKFGLSLADYQSLLSTQGSVCAICQNKCRRNTYLSVDHDHATGKIRGLLCDRCNRAVGMFADDAGLLRRASDYLDRSEKC